MSSIAATQESTIVYRSSELETVQARPDSPFGMQFLVVPVSSAPPSPSKEVSTRSCEETSQNGKSKLDCIDDDD